MAATIPSTYNAWHYSQFGEPDAVLKRGDLPFLSSGPRDVTVRVKAAALNPVDLYILRGQFAPPPLPAVPGKDFAGEVVAVGPEVSSFKVGDSVYGATFVGSVAEYTVVDEAKVAEIPKGWSFTEAASVPIALLTAQEAFERGGLKAGQSVFITAGAGGVGVYAIQLAKALGAARIVATASEEKHALLKELGATETVDYKKDDFVQLYEGAGFDVALDSTRESAKLLKTINPDTGKVVSITDFTAPPPVIAFGLDSKGANLDKLRTFLEERTIKPVLDPTGPYSYEKAVDAYKYLATKKATGKVVVDVEK